MSEITDTIAKLHKENIVLYDKLLAKAIIETDKVTGSYPTTEVYEKMIFKKMYDLYMEFKNLK